MRKYRLHLKIPLPHVSLLPKLSFIHDSLPTPTSSAGGWGIEAAVSSHVVYAASSIGKNFTLSLPAPVWGPSHGRQLVLHELFRHGSFPQALVPLQPVKEPHAGAGES